MTELDDIHSCVNKIIADIRSKGGITSTYCRSAAFAILAVAERMANYDFFKQVAPQETVQRKVQETLAELLYQICVIAGANSVPMSEVVATARTTASIKSYGLPEPEPPRSCCP